MGTAAEPQPTRNIYRGDTETRRKLKGKVKNPAKEHEKLGRMRRAEERTGT
jgi:lipid-binding SYLF domain-containing protein